MLLFYNPHLFDFSLAMFTNQQGFCSSLTLFLVVLKRLIGKVYFIATYVVDIILIIDMC